MNVGPAHVKLRSVEGAVWPQLQSLCSSAVDLCKKLSKHAAVSTGKICTYEPMGSFMHDTLLDQLCPKKAH